AGRGRAHAAQRCRQCAASHGLALTLRSPRHPLRARPHVFTYASANPRRIRPMPLIRTPLLALAMALGTSAAPALADEVTPAAAPVAVESGDVTPGTATTAEAATGAAPAVEPVVEPVAEPAEAAEAAEAAERAAPARDEANYRFEYVYV